MIIDLLPRYYAEYESNLRYTTIRSVIVDGHEVAWMEYAGHVEVEGREDETFVGRTLHCECEFTHNVGWYLKDGHRFTTDAKRTCKYKRVAMILRQRELEEELVDHGGYARLRDRCLTDRAGVVADAKVLLLALADKGRAGEWVGEDGNGASFYGGFYYLQTAAEIMDEMPMDVMWDAANELVAEGRIYIEGAIICDPREIVPPGEDGLGQHMPVGDVAGVVEDGFRIKAWQPRYSYSPREFVVRAWPVGDGEEGAPIAERRVEMSYDNRWGIDVADMGELEAATDELLSELRRGDAEAQ